MPQETKVLFTGLGGSGKSTCIKRVTQNYFDKRYIATLGVEVHPIIRNRLTIWDTAGQEKFAGLKDGYTIQSNVAVIFVDVGNIQAGLRNLQVEVSNIRRICGEIPIIIAFNKWDLYDPDNPTHAQFLQTLRRTGFPVVKLSCKTGENVDFLIQTVLYHL